MEKGSKPRINRN